MDLTWLLRLFLRFFPQLIQDIIVAAFALEAQVQVMSVGGTVHSDRVRRIEGSRTFFYSIHVDRTA